ncbi:MAG: peroxidase-related enzyme [Pseudomonadota bacterium]
MSWIKTVNRPDKDDPLCEAYAKIRESRGKVSNIMKAQSLFPEALDHHLELYQCLMYGESTLEPAEREMVALVVSASNNCAYSVSHVADALASYEKDNTRMQQIVTGRQFLELSDRQATMLRYATKLTQQPDKMGQDDVQGLRDAGLDDREILEVNMLAAYFNFSNRIACGLGVEFSEDEITGYKQNPKRKKKR